MASLAESASAKPLRRPSVPGRKPKSAPISKSASSPAKISAGTKVWTTELLRLLIFEEIYHEGGKRKGATIAAVMTVDRSTFDTAATILYGNIGGYEETAEERYEGMKPGFPGGYLRVNWHKRREAVMGNMSWRLDYAKATKVSENMASQCFVSAY